MPELVPIRYGRMLVSPFTFFRGAAALMASDLSDGPRTAMYTQLCGDAHLMNFGTYAAPDRRMVFGINDFDETLPGPFEWDVKRLAASFAVAGRDRGFAPKARSVVNLDVVRGYREAMHGFAAMRNLDIWYARLDIEQLVAGFEAKMSPAEVERLEHNLEHARTKDSLKAFAKLTTVVDGQVRIVSDPPLVERMADLVEEGKEQEIIESVQVLLRTYRRSLTGDRRRLLERFQLRRRRAQGRRRRQRRHAGLDRAHARPRRRRPAVPPGEGGTALRPRAVRRQERVRQPRPARRGGPAADAGRERHPARLDCARRDWITSCATSTSASCGTRRGRALVDLMDPPVMAGLRPAVRLDARQGPCPLGRRDRHRRLPRVARTPSTAAIATFAEAYADQNERDYAALEGGRRVGPGHRADRAVAPPTRPAVDAGRLRPRGRTAVAASSWPDTGGAWASRQARPPGRTGGSRSATSPRSRRGSGR